MTKLRNCVKVSRKNFARLRMIIDFYSGMYVAFGQIGTCSVQCISLKASWLFFKIHFLYNQNRFIIFFNLCILSFSCYRNKLIGAILVNFVNSNFIIRLLNGEFCYGFNWMKPALLNIFAQWIRVIFLYFNLY